jgi:hypothetical protein
MLMQRTFGGYTLIEVMIFLAVSTVLLAVTIVAIRGQQAHTEFISGMNDVNTKFQQWVDQVVNGLSGSGASPTSATTNIKCSVNEASNVALPQLQPSNGGERGGNPQCIFLGKVIHINDQASANNNHIYTYTVIGRRNSTDVNGNLSNSKDLVSARPVAAAGSPVDLTEDYNIPNGVKILGVDNTNGGTTSHLGGFFISFNNETINNGATGLAAVQYPFTSNAAANNSSVTNCIALSVASPCAAPPTPNLWLMSKWKILFGSPRGDDTACLIVTSSQGVGVSTQVKYGTGNTLCNAF